MAGMTLALHAMWAANVLDIQKTLHQVCKRLLREPGITKQESKLRAQALAELGRIYCSAEVPPEQQKDQDQQMQEALQKLQELYMGQVGEEEQEEANASHKGGARGPGR